MTILFVGPLPPPVHGFSVISEAMLNRINRRTQTLVFDRSPTAGRSALALRILHWVRQLARFTVAALKRRPKAAYIGLSGGMGQWLDLPYMLVARVCGIRLYVHHHSFAYIAEPTAISRFCMKLSRTDLHITLCHTMANDLSRAFNMPLGNVRVLSNTSFLFDIQIDDPREQPSPPEKCTGLHPDLIRIGFLSNITEEKGIFDFFSVLDRAAFAGLAFKATIAGPVDSAISDRFQKELELRPNVKHVGPVYGSSKALFLSRIDVLLFPTRYPNEAEPVTLLEAMQAGVSVVAARRGCIEEMVPAVCGTTCSLDDFPEHSLKFLVDFARHAQPVRAAIRQRIHEQYAISAAEGNRALDDLLFEMCE